jgi:hypothetical protein
VSTNPTGAAGDQRLSFPTVRPAPPRLEIYDAARERLLLVLKITAGGRVEADYDAADLTEAALALAAELTRIRLAVAASTLDVADLIDDAGRAAGGTMTPTELHAAVLAALAQHAPDARGCCPDGDTWPCDICRAHLAGIPGVQTALTEPKAGPVMSESRLSVVREAIDEAWIRRGWRHDEIRAQVAACLRRGARDYDVRDALYCLAGDPYAAHLGLSALPAVTYGLTLCRRRERLPDRAAEPTPPGGAS